MTMVLTSTTDSRENMEAALRPTAEWKTPPASEEERPGTAETVTLDKLSPTEFIERRNAQQQGKKENPPEFLQDDKKEDKPGRRSTGKAQRTIDKLTARNYAATRRAEMAEARAAELELRLNGGASQSTSMESRLGEVQDASLAPPNEDGRSSGMAPAPSPGVGPHPIEHVAEVLQRHPDFREALAEADHSGAVVSESLQHEILKASNSNDIIYFLAKNDDVREALMQEPETAAQRVAQLSHDLKAMRGATRNASMGAPDAETARQQQLFSSHNARVEAALKSLPDAAQLFAAAGQVKVLPHVGLAVIEQENSHDVVIHLARHHDTLNELNAMSPTQAAGKIGRIAEQLESKKNTVRRERLRLPAPLSPVGGGSSASVSVPLDQSDIHTFMKTRNKQEREWKQRTGR